MISLSVVEPELSGQRWRFADYPALSRYQTRILAMPSVRDTVSMDHIIRGYYSIKALNPTEIVPVEPALPTPLAA